MLASWPAVRRRDGFRSHESRSAEGAADSTGKVDDHGAGATRFDHVPRQVEPVRAAVEDHAIGRRDDLAGSFQDGVGVIHQLDGPVGDRSAAVLSTRLRIRPLLETGRSNSQPV